ncbi:MAG TPA: FAD-dependent oxidoreductase [Candidatus Binataceae bacterium]|nr:FAD-dependent oxidoreductase [Candidatus Binataceae bacterium]
MSELEEADCVENFDVVVIGGGLAGLCTASFAASAGARVALYESSPELGGRARTRIKEGYYFNYGAHALYRGGALDTALRDQGVVPRGNVPKLAAGYFVRDRTLHRAPFSASGLKETTLYPSAVKAEVGAALARFGKSAPEVGPGVNARQAVEEFSPSPHVRELISAMLRLTSLIHDPDAADGATLFGQLHRGLSNNAVYVDDGWNQLVSALTARADAGRCQLGVGRRVTAIKPGQTWRVETSGGHSVSAPAVVIALPPRDALELLPNVEALRVAADRSVAVYAACLDLGLSQLPEPRHQFALGIDEPLYLSVHSSAARLAPEGGALVHILRYLEPDRQLDKAVLLAELEGFADLLQPGWRSYVRARQFFWRMPVMCAEPLARFGGLAGRPSVAVPGSPGLYLAGDWVGSHSLLSDAAAASGRLAGEMAAAFAQKNRSSAQPKRFDAR